METVYIKAPFEEKYLDSLPCFDGICGQTASWYGGLIRACPDGEGVKFTCDFPEKEMTEFISTAQRAAQSYV